MLGALAGLMGLVGLVVALGAYRVHYTSWPWQGEPYRLHYCDRTYDRFPGGPRGTPTVARPSHYRAAFRAPPLVGREVLIPVAERCGDDAVPTNIYRSAGDGRYRDYVLLGGP